MKILVIDDEPGLRHTLSLILAGEGHDVATASDGESGLAHLREHGADLVLCDVRMPGIDGLEFLDRHTAARGDALVIVMSAYGDDESAIAAMQRGAYDYIPKPFKAEQVILVVRKAIERERLRQQVEQLTGEITALRGDESIIGRSSAMRSVTEMARKAARHPTTVLITGESGTGKELVARLVHVASPRAERAFVAVNCAAIPEALLESELFGHARGAFTGAVGERRGLFEEADGGTLFLDEIGDLPPLLQVKLLRALQEGEIRRVGDNVSLHVDVRVIAATAKRLDQAVAAGTFRADLYYRLNVVHLELPPLRDRGDDVIALAEHFVMRFASRLGYAPRPIAPAAMRLLLDYSWPGNVRELENTIERALVIAEGAAIDVAHLPSAIRARGSEPPLGGRDLSVKRTLARLERELIEEALRRTGGNRTRAAKLLELSHRALLYKIREYGLDGVKGGAPVTPDPEGEPASR